MGLSFAGPGAPPPRRPRLLPTAGLCLLAVVLASALTALAANAMFLTTNQPWISYVLQPFGFLLLPGFVLESIPRNPHFYSNRGVVLLSAVFYSLLFFWLLRRRTGSRG